MMLHPVPLFSLAEVRSGGGAPQDPKAFTETGHPFIRAGSLPKLLDGENEDSLEKLEPAIAEKHGLKLFPVGTVLFAKSGMSATKGHIYRLRNPAYVVNHLAALVPHDPDDSAFLLCALQRFSPTTLIKDSAYPSIRLGDIEHMKVLAPSDSADRKRIAEVLNQAEALRAKRRAALAQLDTITDALFLDLFGGAANNDWTVATVSDVAATNKGSIRTGPFGSQLLHSEFVDKGVAVLGIDNVVANEFRWGGRRYITESKYNDLERYTVRPGDVLITIMGTCGRCAVVPDNIPLAINTKHLCCITLDDRKAIPVYVQAYFLKHPEAQRYLTRTAKGAIMEGLNMGIIKKMPIPVPPMELQRKYERRAAAVEKLRRVHRTMLEELDSLFSTLQHRAFGGEL